MSKHKGSQKPGSQRAAQFLMVMGEEYAASVLKNLSANEVQKIGLEMTRMGEIETEEVNQVLGSFLRECESNQYISIAADKYTKNVLVQALGEEEAKGVIEKIMLGGDTKGLDALRYMEPQLIAGIIQSEHPQIQAIVISHLGDELSGEVLTYLPKGSVADLVVRMAELDTVDPIALQELNYSLEKQVEGVVTKQSASMGGLKDVANILNLLDKEYGQDLMKKITEINSEIASKIQEQMFVFEDLGKIPGKDFQLLLREVATDKLALALKGADQALSEKVTSNMSARAAEIFQEDMENLGPVKVSDVEDAQKEILVLTKQLAESGQIELSADASTMIS